MSLQPIAYLDLPRTGRIPESIFSRLLTEGWQQQWEFRKLCRTDLSFIACGCEEKNQCTVT
jgi:hypothetical protein